MIERRLSVWPPLPPAAHLRREQGPSPAPFPLGEPGYRLFARGRHAIWHGVRALGLAEGDEILVPAYHHGSEIEALLQAGLVPRWYEGDPRLEPDEAELQELLGPRVRALHLIHYLGFPQDAGRWRGWCDERELLLFEDAAQAWLAWAGSKPVGAAGDLAMFCLYKTVGISEGAALVTSEATEAPPLDPRFGFGVLARRHAAWLTQRSALANATLGWLSRPREYSSARDRDLGDPDAGPWASVGRLLSRLVDPGIAAVRRAHYAILLESLQDVVGPPFDRLPEGASPWAFPIITEDKRGLLDRLERQGIRALDLWSVPHPSLPADSFPEATRRRATTLALPVHQELQRDDLDHIAVAVRGGGSRPVRRQERLEPLGSIESLREDWTRLAEGVGNVFSTWEFASCWWRHFGRGADLELHGWRTPGGELTAIAPLYGHSARGFAVIRMLGHDVADQLDLLCPHRDRAAVAQALRCSLSERNDWDLCVADRLPESGGWAALLDAGLIGTQPSPVLDIQGRDWESFLGDLSANLRSQIRRRERKLIREHGLRYRLADDPARLDEDLERLFALHDARWGEESSTFSGARRAFHREFASLALERGWLRLWLAEVDGRTAAAWYGFRYGGSEWYYQAGRDPDLASLSVGWVLLVHSLRSAVEDGQHSYRFLRGRESFKYRLANRDAPVQTLVLSRGLGGRLASATGRGLARTQAGRGALARALG